MVEKYLFAYYFIIKQTGYNVNYFTSINCLIIIIIIEHYCIIPFYKIFGLLTQNLTLNYIQDVAPPSLLEVVS